MALTKFLKPAARRLARTEFARKAIAEKADLTPFKARPTARIIAGLIIMGFSYVIGWPLISFLGILAVWVKQPLILVIGGPVAYGISHLVFLAGFYLAGAYYTMVFTRWATRAGIEYILQSEVSAKSVG